MKIKPLSIGVIILIMLLSSSNHSSGANINRVKVGPAAPDPHKIGVKAGDWAIYEYNSYITEANQHPYDSLMPPTRRSESLYRIEVLKTSENNLTFQRWIQTNHTYPQMTQDWISHGTITANPAELYSDPETTYIQVFFSGKDLKPGDQLASFLGDIPILVNDTQVLRIGEVDREVIHIQVNYSRNVTSDEGVERRIALADFLYDKATGLMVRWDYSYTGLVYGLQNQLLAAVTLSQNYDLRETNVWLEPIWLRRDVLGGLDVVLLLLLVIVLGTLFLRRQVHQRI